MTRLLNDLWIQRNCLFKYIAPTSRQADFHFCCGALASLISVESARSHLPQHAIFLRHLDCHESKCFHYSLSANVPPIYNSLQLFRTLRLQPSMADSAISVVAAAYTLTALSFLIILTRILLRILIHERFKYDDYLMLFSTALYGAFTASFIVAVSLTARSNIIEICKNCLAPGRTDL